MKQLLFLAVFAFLSCKQDPPLLPFKYDVEVLYIDNRLDTFYLEDSTPKLKDSPRLGESACLSFEYKKIACYVKTFRIIKEYQ